MFTSRLAENFLLEILALIFFLGLELIFTENYLFVSIVFHLAVNLSGMFKLSVEKILNFCDVVACQQKICCGIKVGRSFSVSQIQPCEKNCTLLRADFVINFLRKVKFSKKFCELGSQDRELYAPHTTNFQTTSRARRKLIFDIQPYFNPNI